MDYEKKYKYAMEAMREWIAPCHTQEQLDNLKRTIFPELKESEDEKIRESLLEYLHTLPNHYAHSGVCAPEWIAWLEKQEGCEYIKKDWLEHIKQSWYKEGFIDGKYSDGTSKEWTKNDAATLKELIDFLENGTVKLQHDLTLYANWLKTQFSPIEKQGEQKDICGKCKKAQPYHSCQDITALGRCYIEGMNTANKDEPKFHEGEWITNGDYTWKIVEVKPLDYILQSQNGSIVDDTISHVDEQFHSFTIKDAKDGDVLAAHECVVLFKEIDGLNIKCYCTYHYIGFNPSFYVDTLQNKTAFQPATKEQRDLLFQKMREAGYEWDKEKKELKLLITNGGDFD